MFLNREISPALPYYSVRAPETQSIGGWESYFVEWQAHPDSATFQYPESTTTGVVFKAANATVSARYKAHLGSSMASASGSNSQRVVVSHEQEARICYMAYESAGEVWYSRSADGGTTWDPEIRLSDGNKVSGAPAIAVWTGNAGGEASIPLQLDVHVLYRKQMGNDHQIVHREFRQRSDGVWYPEQLLPEEGTSATDTRPVVTVAGDLKLIASAQLDAELVVWEATRPSVDAAWSWQRVAVSPSLPPANPSLSGGRVDGAVIDPCVLLTSDDGSDVRLAIADLGFASETVPASITPVSFRSRVSGDGNPEYPRGHISWEALHQYETSLPPEDGPVSPVYRNKVMYQGLEGWEFTEAHEFINGTSGSYFHPVVTLTEEGTVRMAWDDGTSAYEAVKNGTEWEVTRVFASALHPNYVGEGVTGPLQSARLLFTLPSAGPPYRLALGEADNPMVLRQEYSRELIVATPSGTKGGFSPPSDSAGGFSLRLTPLRYRSGQGEWVEVPFAPVQPDSGTGLWASLRSEPFMVPGGADSVMVQGWTGSRRIARLTAKPVRLRWEVRDAVSGAVLATLGSEVSHTRDRVKLIGFKGRGLAALAGRRVVMHPVVKGFEDSQVKAYVLHVHTVVDDGSGATLAGARATGTPEKDPVPASFALLQNYPNPFNPSTTIRYALPERSTVTLAVYNTLGQEVATLVRGEKEAGYHEAGFDASGLASGVYLFRLTAGTFVETRKLLLIH